MYNFFYFRRCYLIDFGFFFVVFDIMFINMSRRYLGSELGRVFFNFNGFCELFIVVGYKKFVIIMRKEFV